jgi:hypothetical protein
MKNLLSEILKNEVYPAKLQKMISIIKMALVDFNNNRNNAK